MFSYFNKEFKWFFVLVAISVTGMYLLSLGTLFSSEMNFKETIENLNALAVPFAFAPIFLTIFGLYYLSVAYTYFLSQFTSNKNILLSILIISFMLISVFMPFEFLNRGCAVPLFMTEAFTSLVFILSAIPFIIVGGIIEYFKNKNKPQDEDEIKEAL